MPEGVRFAALVHLNETHIHIHSLTGTIPNLKWARIGSMSERSTRRNGALNSVPQVLVSAKTSRFYLSSNRMISRVLIVG